MASDAPPWPTAGETLGSHELFELLQSDSLASEWVALPHASGAGIARVVALVSAQPAARQAFLDNARRATGIRHARLMGVIEAGEHASGVYAAFELTYAASFRDLLKRGVEAGRRMPLDIVMRIALDAATGLEALHGARIVHGDLSPRHFVVTPQGAANLAQSCLGVPACLLWESVEAIRLAYKAPEQLEQPLRADPRSDVFSLGVVLWEALAGRPLFLCASPRETRAALQKRPIPRLDEVADVPQPIADEIARALAREARSRHRDAAEFRVRLQGAGRRSVAKREEVTSVLQDLAGEALAEQQAHYRSLIGNRTSLITNPGVGPESQGTVTVRPPQGGSGAHNLELPKAPRAPFQALRGLANLGAPPTPAETRKPEAGQAVASSGKAIDDLLSGEAHVPAPVAPQPPQGPRTPAGGFTAPAQPVAPPAPQPSLSPRTPAGFPQAAPQAQAAVAPTPAFRPQLYSVPEPPRRSVLPWVLVPLLAAGAAVGGYQAYWRVVAQHEAANRPLPKPVESSESQAPPTPDAEVAADPSASAQPGRQRVPGPLPRRKRDASSAEQPDAGAAADSKLSDAGSKPDQATEKTAKPDAAPGILDTRE